MRGIWSAVVCGLAAGVSGQPGSIFEPIPWPAHDATRLASGAPGPAYWQQRADYEISARLDPASRTVTGSLRCAYTNNSPHELRYLWLNLEQNAFRPDSIGSRALPPEMWWRTPSEFVGGFTLGDAAVDGTLVPVAVYDTMGKVDLPEPLVPGGSLVLELDFSMTIPPEGRLGVYEAKAGEVFQLAHWFPNVAVYDDTHGWNILPHQGDGEFYTNFGRFEVELTVPADHVVAAPGELVNASEVLSAAQRDRLAQAWESVEAVVIRGFDEIPAEASAETATWRFVAENVRTFAWASSRSFRWDAAVASPERRVLCQAFYSAEGHGEEGSPGWEKAVEYGRHAINYYSDWLFEYPYPTATNVGGVVGGMEYPGIVFCSIGRNPKSLFGVTDHEFGHQWFPMVVNSDERRHAWMDEGFNTFMNHYSFTTYWNEPEERFGGQSVAQADRGVAQPIATYPDRIRDGALGYLAYAKPGYAMRVLRDVVLGPERFDAAFREYIRRWAYKSPRPEDFFRTMEDAAGADLSWFWRGWFLEQASFDQGFDMVQPEAELGHIGAEVVNYGRMVMPVDLEVTYTDGTVERRRLPVEAWAQGESFPMMWPSEGRSIAKLRLDPEGWLPDADLSDNAWDAAAAADTAEEEAAPEAEDPAAMEDAEQDAPSAG